MVLQLTWPIALITLTTSLTCLLLTPLQENTSIPCLNREKDDSTFFTAASLGAGPDVSIIVIENGLTTPFSQFFAFELLIYSSTSSTSFSQASVSSSSLGTGHGFFGLYDATYPICERRLSCVSIFLASLR
jgi:hypothetical protein